MIIQDCKKRKEKYKNTNLLLGACCHLQHVVQSLLDFQLCGYQLLNLDASGFHFLVILKVYGDFGQEKKDRWKKKRAPTMLMF